MFREHSDWNLLYCVYLYPCHGATRIENTGFLLALFVGSQGKPAVSYVFFDPFPFEARTSVLLAAIF